jgi:hypothetical protein
MSIHLINTINTFPGGKMLGNAVLNVMWRRLPRIVLLSALLTFSLSASIIQYEVMTSGGSNGTGNGATGTYQFFVSGFVFRANQPCLNNPTLECSEALDIQFDQTMFGQLSNGIAPAGFDLLLFQPNNPPQAPGDYSALALVDKPSLLGQFSVDFTFTGQGTPGSQAFTIDQFDSNGGFQGVVLTGETAPLASSVPEPSSVSLIAAGLLASCFLLAFRLALERARKRG